MTNNSLAHTTWNVKSCSLCTEIYDPGDIWEFEGRYRENIKRTM